MKRMGVEAPDIHREFEAGNFVVKRNNNYFKFLNEVPADQSTE